MEFGVGTIVEGKVTGITKFGAFVSLPEGKSGLVHISEIAYSYVNDVKDHLKEGQEVKVKVIGSDENGRINLSIKEAMDPPPRPASHGAAASTAVSGVSPPPLSPLPLRTGSSSSWPPPTASSLSCVRRSAAAPAGAAGNKHKRTHAWGVGFFMGSGRIISAPTPPRPATPPGPPAEARTGGGRTGPAAGRPPGRPGPGPGGGRPG